MRLALPNDDNGPAGFPESVLISTMAGLVAGDFGRPVFGI